MSQADDEDARPWTDNDLKEALRRINAGEINIKEAENYYGISPRTLHRQRAIENMRAQLNPEKAKKMKSASTATRKDVTILRKPIEISCSSFGDIVSLLDTGTEEVKQLLNHECDIIYECKVCKNLFRSLVNFISHKRIYCCDMYSVLHTQSDENEDGSEVNDPAKTEAKLKAKENLKEFITKPFRITCRKDLTAVLKRISAMSEFIPAEPILHLQSMENTPCAYQQNLIPSEPPEEVLESPKSSESTEALNASPEAESKKEATNTSGKTQENSASLQTASYVAEKRFRCPLCPSNFTIKKSVARHMKFVHHKSEEQLEKLKHRVQMHYVKKKTASTENTKAQPPPPAPPPPPPPLVLASPSLAPALPAPQPPAPPPPPPVPRPSQPPAPRLSQPPALPPQQPLSLPPQQPPAVLPQQSPAPPTQQISASSVAQPSAPVPSQTLAPSQSEENALPASKKTKQSPEKGEWEKDCPCHRHFTNRNSYASHMRVCRQKLALKNAAEANSSMALKQSLSLLPIVSLTPITASALASALENVDTLDLLSNQTKKLAASHSKKVTLPLTAPSTASKKIGIQVRMNYCKEGVSQPNSINGTPVSYPGTAAMSAQSSTDNSRRNSVVSVTRDEKPDAKLDLLNGHNTRSNSKLAHILKSLLHRQGTKEESGDGGGDQPEMKREDTNATIAKKMEKNDVTIFCEDCKMTYPLNEYPDNRDSAPRSFKCALRNCDFKSDSKSALLPHLSVQHPILSESELAEVDSVFIAEACGGRQLAAPRTNAANCCGRVTSLSRDGKPDERRKKMEKPRVLNPSGALSGKAAQVGSSKRKSNPNPCKQSQPKRKVIGERRIASAANGEHEAQASVKAECESPTVVTAAGKQDNVKKEKVEETENAATNAAAVPKKVKKLARKEDDGKVRIIRKRKPTQPSSVPPMIVQNGVETISSSEEDELPYLNIAKLNYSKPVKKQNTFPIDSKVLSKAPKTNCVPNDVPQSSSVPGNPKSTNVGYQRLQPPSESATNVSEINLDSDLDPTTMSEEMIKKSIMTIIFGKDVPAEKIDETVATIREKSPASSTSSDGGKEKRYRFRPVKPVAAAPVVKTVPSAVETKDDKVVKVSIVNKTKAPR